MYSVRKHVHDKNMSYDMKHQKSVASGANKFFPPPDVENFKCRIQSRQCLAQMEVFFRNKFNNTICTIILHHKTFFFTYFYVKSIEVILRSKGKLEEKNFRSDQNQ